MRNQYISPLHCLTSNMNKTLNSICLTLITYQILTRHHLFSALQRHHDGAQYVSTLSTIKIIRQSNDREHNIFGIFTIFFFEARVKLTVLRQCNRL